MTDPNKSVRRFLTLRGDRLSAHLLLGALSMTGAKIVGRIEAVYTPGVIVPDYKMELEFKTLYGAGAFHSMLLDEDEISMSSREDAR